MKGTLITLGIILLVIGLIGLISNTSVGLMWVLLILGVIGVIWGASVKGKATM